MKEANMPFDGGKLAPELRVGLGDAKGELFALPIGLSTPVLFINKAAFRKAGLDPEKPPKTWAEMLKAADKLFDAGSTCPYTTSWPSWVHIDNLSSWNGVEVSDAKGRLNFNGLVQVKHTAMLTTWAKARFFIYFGRRDEADNRFAAGECGMLTSSSSLYGALHESRKVEVGVSSLPYHDDVPGAPQQTLAGGYSLWVGAGQKPAEYKGVAQFVSFLMEPDLQVEFSAVAGFPADDAGGACGCGQQAVEGRYRRSQCRLRAVAGPRRSARAARFGDRAGADHHRGGTRSRLVGQDAGQTGARQRCPAGQSRPCRSAKGTWHRRRNGRSDCSAPRLALAARLRAPLRGCAGAGEHPGRSAHRRPAGSAGGRIRRDAVGGRFAVAAARRNAGAHDERRRPDMRDT
jgi:hypothetical protein